MEFTNSSGKDINSIEECQENSVSRVANQIHYKKYRNLMAELLKKSKPNTEIFLKSININPKKHGKLQTKLFLQDKNQIILPLDTLSRW